MQTHETAPLTFIRPRVGPRPGEVRQTLLLLEFDSAFRARGGLKIMFDSFGCGPAPRRQAAHFEFRNYTLQRQTQAIANANAMRRLDAFGIQVHLAAVDGHGRKTARLEEPDVPQPFVQAMIIGFFVGWHN